MSVARESDADGAAADELEDRLLDAAASAFARRGFDGTRIADIVREAGLSAGAVYGRFSSREDLLRRAIISRSVPHLSSAPEAPARVADLVSRRAAHTESELSEVDALLLEAFVAARRHPPIADALQEAQHQWSEGVRPLVDAALEDGSLSAALEVDAVLYFLRVLRLGRSLLRSSGVPAPEQAAWEEVVGRVVASLGDRPVTESTEGKAGHDID